MLRCDLCADRACVSATCVEVSRVCPNKHAIQKQAQVAYQQEDHLLAVASHVATRDGYPWASRVEEIMLFAARMGYTHLGVAFCITLAAEARIFCQVLCDNGFRVSSALCKTGALPRELLGDVHVCDIVSGMSPALCNPVAQALLLNQENTHLNVVLGLCVGHDSLFFKHAQAPCTYLAVKDRACNHEPLRPLHEHDGVYRRIHHLDLPQACDGALQWRNEVSAVGDGAAEASGVGEQVTSCAQSALGTEAVSEVLPTRSTLGVCNYAR